MFDSQEKQRIRSSFNRAAKTYDDYCCLQNKICFQLITHLKKIEFTNDSIADFGCGTGISTQYLIDHFSYNRLYAIDMATELLDVAKFKLKNHPIKFIAEDFDKIIFPKNSLDLAFSNMALQWSVDLTHSIYTIAVQLKKGGVLAFALPLQGTFCEINSNSRNMFHEISDIKSLLEKLNFQLELVNEQSYLESFPTIAQAAQSIKCIGANCILNKNPKLGLSKNSLFVDIFNDTTRCSLTYRIGYFITRKFEDHGN